MVEGDRQLWFAAIKPPMYSVAVIPIWVGTMVAFADTGEVNLRVFFTFLMAAILIVAWSNLSNDVFDADTGVDVNKAHSVVTLTGNKSLVFWIGNGCLALGIGGILAIAWSQQDWTVLALIGVCCALGYSYQGPPFRFGYQGWGEIICFICYGPLALSAVYYSQTQAWSMMNLAAAGVIGMTTTVILFCSHFHQVADDSAAGKRSPIVRLGTLRGAQLLPWLGGSAYGWVVVAVMLGFMPVWALLSLLSLPGAIKLFQFVHTHHDQPDLVKSCKFLAVSMHFWSGALLGLGFMIHRLIIS